MSLFCCMPWICAFFKFRWSTSNMKKHIWPDLNSQVFKLTPLHPREENHPEMVNMARVFTFRSSHQHHCHSFRFSFQFSFFLLVSSTSSTSLAIWTHYMKTKTKLYKLLHFQWKNHPAFDCQSFVSENDYEPPTNNTGHCTCGGYGCTSEPNPILTCQICWAIRKKKGLRLPEGCFRIAHMWLDEQLLFFFGKQLSENHRLLVFSMDVSCWKSQDLQKTAKLGEKSTRKIKMWGQWLVFVLGPWRQSVLSSKVTTYPTSPAKNLAARKHSNTVGSCCSTMLPCLQPAEVRSWRYGCFPSQPKPPFGWINTRFTSFFMTQNQTKY